VTSQRRRLYKGARSHGRFSARQHGQGSVAEADREHEVPSFHGALAALEKHCSDEGVHRGEREDRPPHPRP